MDYDFADQSLLGDLFYGRWVALPYIYNALKTLRRRGVHETLWSDKNVKNVHFILSPKPWDKWRHTQNDHEELDNSKDLTFAWWDSLNQERLVDENERGVGDHF